MPLLPPRGLQQSMEHDLSHRRDDRDSLEAEPRSEAATQLASSAMTERAVSIGTLREKPLHASLKQWYSEPGDRVEVPVESFVIDLVRGDLLIEIQTRGFASMKRKLRSLLDHGYRVRIVHPIPIENWIVKIDDGGTILDRRRSPKRGVLTDLFSEMVSFPDLLVHPGLEIEVLLTQQEELRRHTPDKAWRRKGWVVV